MTAAAEERAGLPGELGPLGPRGPTCPNRAVQALYTRGDTHGDTRGDTRGNTRGQALLSQPVEGALPLGQAPTKPSVSSCSVGLRKPKAGGHPPLPVGCAGAVGG